jgi:hypothetical protein
MSQVLINQYLAGLDRVKKVSGSTVSAETMRIVEAIKGGPR